MIKKLLQKLFLNENPASKKKDDNLKCPGCKNDQWIQGPGGGSYGNITYGKCGNKYNNLGPFGLQPIS